MYLSKTVKLSCLDNIESILFGYDMILFNPSACLSPIGSRRSFVAIGGWSHSRSLCPGFSRRPRRRLGHDGIGDEVRYVVLTLRWFRRFCWRGRRRRRRRRRCRWRSWLHRSGGVFCHRHCSWRLRCRVCLECRILLSTWLNINNTRMLLAEIFGTGLFRSLPYAARLTSYVLQCQPRFG